VSDNLDQLSDTALSEVFAVEVLNWKRGINCDGRPAVWPPDCEPYTKRKQGEWPYGISIGATYAVSADAVLEHFVSGELHTLRRKPERAAFVDTEHGRFAGYASTFARAACLALIRAKRAEKGGRS
jgi:hypothetical protein